MTRGIHSRPEAERRLRRRQASEMRFRIYGIGAIVISLTFLLLMFASICTKGYTAFQQTFVALEVYFDPKIVTPDGDVSAPALSRANYDALIKAALAEKFPEVTKRNDKRALYSLISIGAGFELRTMVIDNPALLGERRVLWLPADDEVDMLVKGHVSRDVEASKRRLSDKQIGWVETLEREGLLEKRFNTTLFTAGDSREPELAGIWGAALGSLFTLLVTLFLSFPVGVGAAVYLEEFAPKNRWTDLIEVNINNLAAVPSIVFGLLGLAIFINLFGVPRSVPLVGGLVLSLMTLPTIIITSRVALKAIPPWIRDAALGLGASRVQTVFHHVVPSALPGILTGTIIGMARALGETAPLLMIGMVAFIVEPPGGLTDPATALPVQIFLWADSPERAFVERTSAAIMVLLTFLVAMNGLAVVLRNRFEQRW